jgi:pullulanase/glycogen debranching enzyme
LLIRQTCERFFISMPALPQPDAHAHPAHKILRPWVPRMLQAYWQGWTEGVLVLRRNWTVGKALPTLKLEPTGQVCAVTLAPPEEFALQAGYFCRDRQFHFVLNCQHYPELDWLREEFYVAGEFNAWGQSIGNPKWQLKPLRLGDALCFGLTLSQDTILRPKKGFSFKFVSSKGQWLDVPQAAPNRVQDAHGHWNYEMQPDRTGLHRLCFRLAEPSPTWAHDQLVWMHGQQGERLRVDPGPWLLSLGTQEPLGAYIRDGKTYFGVFAPRAKAVEVVFFKHLDQKEGKVHLALSRLDKVYWAAQYPANLHGYYYHYYVCGDNTDNLSHFDAAAPILDPYAQLTVGPAGPGIIVDAAAVKPGQTSWQPPPWQNLVVLEGHVQDLLALRPEQALAQRAGQSPPSTLKALGEYLQQPGNYVQSLGANALELLPITASESQGAYHWGYMPVNYFAPHPSYTTEPTGLGQIAEVQDFVQNCHRAGLAVILDVVYNHVGSPNALLFLDKYHYFECSPEGALSNHSGCGNDLRASAPMAKRLILDSLRHWVQVYDVDGFRFDLAELLGVAVLREIESALKALKPSIILIAEPWSFRGHIAQALKPTGFAFWNDGYRNFIREYVQGQGNSEALAYYLAGSLSHAARFPSQSVNYPASHDDWCWLDAITENPGHNALAPSWLDRRRTHLMAALLFSSIGMPMLAAGTDFLHSKHGVSNTYQRPDLNALSLDRLLGHAGTHAYFAWWIRLRLHSAYSPLWCLQDVPGPGYLRFFYAPGTSAVAVLYNADCSLGQRQVLFAINPHAWAVSINLQGLSMHAFQCLADHERFGDVPLVPAPQPEHLPALSCALWVRPC